MDDSVANYLKEISADPSYENILLQIGSTSNDNEVTIGRDGIIFLLGGSNKVIQQYSSPEWQEKASAWITLIQNRQEYFLSKGISFCQMIVPEKQSVIPEYYPGILDVPTPALAEISKHLNGTSFYLDCQKLLRDLFIVGGSIPFRKVDSHLSYFGTECLARGILQHFKIKITGEIFAKKMKEDIALGDLSGKFFQGGIAERMLVPDLAEWEFAQQVPILTFSKYPPTGLGGTILEWEAQSPLSSKKLLVFGNSMFERGGGPLGLSWWVGRIFSKTRFIWDSNVLDEHMQEFKPDAVICQSVERFLTIVPHM
jgi:hypothetical protein